MATRYWRLASGGVWTSTANWSQVDGGVGGFSPPGTGDFGYIRREITSQGSITGIGNDVSTMPVYLRIDDFPTSSHPWIIGAGSESIVVANDFTFDLPGAVVSATPHRWSPRLNGAGRTMTKIGLGWVVLNAPSVASQLALIVVRDGPFGMFQGFGGTLEMGHGTIAPTANLIFDTATSTTVVSAPVRFRRSTTIQNTAATFKTVNFTQPCTFEPVSGTLIVSNALNTVVTFSGGSSFKGNTSIAYSPGSSFIFSGAVDFTSASPFTFANTGNALTISGSTTFNTNVTLFGGGGSQFFTGSVALGDARSLTIQSNSVSMSGTVSGTGGITTSATLGRSRSLFLTGNSSGLSGPCTINSGSLQVAAANRYEPTALNVAGSTSRFFYTSGSADFNFPVSPTGVGGVVIQGNFAGSGVTFPASGPGSVQGFTGSLQAIALSNATNNNSKLVTHHLPQQFWLSGAAFATGFSLTPSITYVGAGETRNTDVIIDSENSVQTSVLTSGVYTLASSGADAIVLTGGVQRTNSGANASARMTLTLAGTNTNANTISGPVTEVGTNSATLGLVKNGTGYWALSGTLSHTGPTTVEQGSLRLEAMSHDNTNTGNISVATGAVLELVTSAATPRRVTGTGNVTVNGTLRTGASGTGTGTARYGGGLTFNTNSVLELGAA